MTWTDKRVLVTGAAGFIGAHLCAALLERGAIVYGLDDLSVGKRAAVPAGVDFVRGDVLDAGVVRSLLVNTAYVFHLAARNVTLSTQYPEGAWAVNAGGAFTVLHMAAQAAVPPVCVLASSVSIYGQAGEIPTPEDAVPHPTNLYAAAKIAGEAVAMALAPRLSTIVLRYSNVYGPGQAPGLNQNCGVVGKFMWAYVDGGTALLLGRGTETRDYTYVDDVVEATLLAAESPQAQGKVFNVGTGVETKTLELAAACAAALGVESHVRFGAARVFDTVSRRAASCQRARDVLHWEARSLMDGLAATAAYWRPLEEG